MYATTAQRPAPAPLPDATKALGRWLVVWAVMLFLVVIVGGATRLTESGLSITEWKPVTGVIPPLSEAQWAEEFAKYQRIPQYERLNAGMSLRDFKAIYLWEFVHRIIARLVGAAYLVPLLWFAARRRIPRESRPVLATLLVLLLLQGAMGWWMVKSGLSVRTEVSQYRLAAHLSLALVVYAITVWTAANFLVGRSRAIPTTGRGRALAALTGFIFVTAGSGALVAGLRAGRIYNTFPYMGDGLVPPGYAQLDPLWRNFFENPATVQFNHRVLAMLTFAAASTLWYLFRRGATGRVAAHLQLLVSAALLQVTLGITTLLLAVPVSLGVAHQGAAVLLLTAAILTWHAAERDGSRSAAA